MTRPKQTYYEILEVATDASIDEIHKAYTRQSKYYHPDRFDEEIDPEQYHDAEEETKLINVAYEVLSDPEKRARYDQEIGVKSGSSSREPEEDLTADVDEPEEKSPYADSSGTREPSSSESDSLPPGCVGCLATIGAIVVLTFAVAFVGSYISDFLKHRAEKKVKVESNQTSTKKAKVKSSQTSTEESTVETSAALTSWDRALFQAVRDEAPDSVKNALALGANINAKEYDVVGGTPLMIAVSLGADKPERISMETLLLDAGADVNAWDTYGSSPLHEAAGNGKVESITLLLDRGANVNAKDNYGSTPLHDAVTNNMVESITPLLDRGADVNAINDDGDTPLDLATQEGYADIAVILKSRGGVE